MTGQVRAASPRDSVAAREVSGSATYPGGVVIFPDLVPVVDPSLPAEEQRRLLRMRERSWSRAHPNVAAEAGGWALGLVSLIVLPIFHFIGWLGWWWMFLIPVPVVTGYVLSHLIDHYHADNDHFNLMVEPWELDESRSRLLLRAQEAIDDALQSKAGGDLEDRAMSKAKLRSFEWDLAIQCRDLTVGHAELARSEKSDTPGPMTERVLNSQRRALKAVEDAATKRINALERYAAQLMAADAAKNDWSQALQASRHNDWYYGLIARTVLDEHATNDLNQMNQQAADAAQAFHDTLDRADMTAEELTLPTPPN